MVLPATYVCKIMFSLNSNILGLTQYVPKLKSAPTNLNLWLIIYCLPLHDFMIAVAEFTSSEYRSHTALLGPLNPWTLIFTKNLFPWSCALYHPCHLLSCPSDTCHIIRLQAVLPTISLFVLMAPFSDFCKSAIDNLNLAASVLYLECCNGSSWLWGFTKKPHNF